MLTFDKKETDSRWIY